MNFITHYFKVWKQTAHCAFASYASSRVDAISFFIGKLIRYAFLWVMIWSIFNFRSSFAGYTKFEALLFFVTFNIVDVASQAIFRGVYFFSNDINRGSFDFALTKPLNPLFHSLFRQADLLDIIFLFPIIGFLIYVIANLRFLLTHLFFYFIALIVGFLFTTALHILSLAFALWTTEGENIIWFYRRTIIVGMFPPEILPYSWQLVFKIFVPIILMVAYPAKAFLGLLSYDRLALAFVWAIIFYSLSIFVWKHGLKRYSSASS